MNASGDAAEQIVRMSLQGVEFVGKMSLNGAEKLIKIILSELKAPKRTKGRASLTTMLKSNKPIKVFELKDEDLKKFCQEAKKYGVMYHVLKDRDKNDGKCDIMVRAEDSSKVNRIFQRFNLGANNKATIRATLDKSRDNIKQPKEKRKPEKSAEDLFLDELFSKPQHKEQTTSENPSLAKMEKSRLSEPTLNRNSNQQKYFQKRDEDSRPSVKAQLKEIEEKRNKNAKQPKAPQKSTKKKGKDKNVRNR